MGRLEPWFPTTVPLPLPLAGSLDGGVVEERAPVLSAWPGEPFLPKGAGDPWPCLVHPRGYLNSDTSCKIQCLGAQNFYFKFQEWSGIGQM